MGVTKVAAFGTGLHSACGFIGSFTTIDSAADFGMEMLCQIGPCYLAHLVWNLVFAYGDAIPSGWLLSKVCPLSRGCCQMHVKCLSNAVKCIIKRVLSNGWSACKDWSAALPSTYVHGASHGILHNPPPLHFAVNG
ncbi:hypothetical protein U1Q18_015119 [Sarracenia purpurea var. burkii]